VLFGALVALATACPAKVDPLPPPVVMETPDAGSIAHAPRGSLRFKGPERLNGDVAAALGLMPDEVCSELGKFGCATVHNVVLGGVDPYGLGLYEASGVTAVTTPLAVERLVWSACSQRVDKDLVAPANAVVFRGLSMSGPKLANADGPEVAAVIGELTRRGLAREPYANEVARYVKLAKDIEGTGSAEPARDWMLGVCFAVLSSAESVFY
jgi:hypothetical protein